MELKGIDLSEHNIINWNQYANLDFVMLRAGYGRLVSQKDKLFEQHYANAKSRGLKVGIYWYSYAKTALEAITEAECCLEIIKGKEIDYPVYFDIEESSQKALGRDTCSDMVHAFCRTIEEAGYASGFYCNLDFYNTVISDFIKKRYTCWLAQWDVTKPSVDVPLWQYHVDSVDHDIAYIDFSTWHKAKTEVETTTKKQEFPIEIKIGNDVYTGMVTKK